MIVNSHYVPLQPPYPVIYYNGEVGMQIGTLIVVEGLDPSRPHPYGNREAPYAIRTHSHPVVSYGNKQTGLITPNVEPNDWSEGVVWDNVQLRDVTVLCHAPNGTPGSSSQNAQGNEPWVHFVAAQNIPQRLYGIVAQERLRNLFSNQQRFSLTNVVRSLARIIPADLAIGIPEPNGSLMLLKGGLRPGENSITSNHIMNLPGFFIAVKMEDSLEANLEAVKMQIEDYLNAVSAKREKVHIEFKCRDEELQSLIDCLNAEYCK
ncbi:MAG: hypothetical protein K5899_06995 [Bacteroidaceae bacterium]|nr:hypothetical protein [Bacteroidaceae bacterium]